LEKDRGRNERDIENCRNYGYAGKASEKVVDLCREPEGLSMIVTLIGDQPVGDRVRVRQPKQLPSPAPLLAPYTPPHSPPNAPRSRTNLLRTSKPPGGRVGVPQIPPLGGALVGGWAIVCSVTVRLWCA
jgi:hypothetical protein